MVGPVLKIPMVLPVVIVKKVLTVLMLVKVVCPRLNGQKINQVTVFPLVDYCVRMVNYTNQYQIQLLM